MRRGLCVFTIVLAWGLAVGPAAGGHPIAANRPTRGPDPFKLLGRLRAAAGQAARDELAAIVRVARARTRPVPARPMTYYVDPVTGSDSNPGTSPASPWRTITRVNAGYYLGGDKILLRGGERFRETLRLDPANVAGTSARAPLTIASYGGGRAVLAPRAASGMVAFDVSGVHVSGVDFAGDARDCRGSTDGIFFDARGVHGVLDRGIAIDHVDVGGFCDGIVIGSDDNGSRIEHVRIADAVAHDNGDSGILTYDQSLKQHDIEDLRVVDSQAYRNDGDGGIVLFGVYRGVVGHSVAYGNGRATSGAAGIWAFDSDRIVLEHDESYGNMTDGTDGDGFDLDAGVSNSVMEYDYSHDNAGIGFLLCACVPWYSEHDDVIRYDVSQEDGSSGQPSGIYVGGGEPFGGVDVFADTVYSAAGAGALVQIDGAGSPYSDVELRNNLFVAGGGKVLLKADTKDATDLAVQGNDWWSAAGRFQIDWGRLRFSSLAAWRAQTGTERLGGQDVGLSVSPGVCALGAGRTMFPRAPGRLTAYRLRPSSRLIDAGLNLRREFGTAVGAHDFTGGSAGDGGGYDIGAVQRRPGLRC